MASTAQRSASRRCRRIKRASVDHIRQPQAGVEAQFAVAEFVASLLHVVAHQLPENRPGHALDQIFIADKDALVGGIEPDFHWLATDGGLSNFLRHRFRRRFVAVFQGGNRQRQIIR